ncbi:acetyl-CoA hydrolase/transferase C-terminal domain-containing protein [Rhodococcus sp. B7740]|uniref:acetyl-CoA hydrolase/transferase C-terminal domain-containing protein n=1 Tax=Rhodococcus sp. B7740 TaxID=1564114 RepID=UPI001187012B|nr:acetyl-CoA hydrolase/transferase C-terminal domain-containing protein [Rhodococcus sp. B7740]
MKHLFFEVTDEVLDNRAQRAIVPKLLGPVTRTRNDVHWVATEYGTVDLKGLSSTQRAQSLIALAHHDFRGRTHRSCTRSTSHLTHRLRTRGHPCRSNPSTTSSSPLQIRTRPSAPTHSYSA